MERKAFAMFTPYSLFGKLLAGVLLIIDKSLPVMRTLSIRVTHIVAAVVVATAAELIARLLGNLALAANVAWVVLALAIAIATVVLLRDKEL
jgi:hypothetical protein